ncbi:insulinase family protein [Clostridiales bacterium FE2011]|nr:insulinase family protein [Clostridiales bacterium FE2011]
MKKLLSLLLALALFVSVLPAIAEPAPADTDETVGLPAVGDVVEGFEVKEIRPFEMVGADLVLFEHQKTGAKLLYIANEDTNRAFQLTFPTRPIDNTGLPHVFEHSTLSGSAKYPSTGLWFNLIYQSYQTYMNAYTMDAMTSYPIASLSEEQLLALADFYTDCCLHPIVKEREDIYRTEAWRYEMEDMDSPLILNGTVYSEMTGAMDLRESALDNANLVTFPGAALTFNYGGKPEAIPEMTWDALKNYHDTYYHPSNCIAYLYGSFEDYTVFLKLLDEAFSPYEKKDFSFTDSGYTRITEPVVTSVPYAVAEGTDTANQSTIYYYIICPGLKENKAQQRAADHVWELLGNSGSLLMQNLKKAFPSGSFSCGRELAAPDDALVFVANNVNKEDAEAFRTVVNDSLKQIAQDGFDTVQLDSIVTAKLLNNKLALESGEPVDTVINNLAYAYAVTGNPFDYVESTEDQANIMNENAQGLLTAAISDWYVDPELYTLTTTYPEPGLKEKQDAALAEKLAEIKAGMTDEEKQAIIDATHAEPEEDENAEMIAALTPVTVADLPEEVREYAITDETGEDGVRRMNAVAGVDGVGKVDLYFDARTLPQEDIHYLRLFTRLLGQLDTDAHSKEELAVLMDRYLMSRTIGVDTCNTPEKDDVIAYLIAEWVALDDDLAAGYDLMKEILFHTQFTDLQTLSERITAQKAYVRNSINNNPYVALYSRQEGVGDPRSRYYDYLNYTSYYAFLEELEAQMASEPETVVARLQNIQSFFTNRSGAVATFAGNEASIAVNAPLVDTFFADIASEEREYPAYDLPVPPIREAVSVDGNIQYNCNCAAFSQIGVEPDYSLNVIGSLIADQLLIPVLRDQMGAYSVWCGTDGDYAMYLISYRDPNVKATFDLYDSIPEKLAAMELTQEQIDGYIMQQYSSLAKPAGELGGAVTAMTNILHRRPADEKLQQMRAYKSVTPESVKAAAEAYAKLMEKGCRGTVGPIGTLQANSDLYDAIQNPFHTEDLSQVSFSDVAEDNEHHDAIYAAFTSGMMAAKEEGLFAPDEPATVGDFLGGLYMLIGGGSNDPDACKETLVGYGLVAADQDLNAELHEDLLCGLLTAIGAEMTTDTPDAAVTRADLADLFVQLSGN